ncbi:hypothetical protein D3C84_412990 [compost metagenome]
MQTVAKNVQIVDGVGPSTAHHLSTFVPTPPRPTTTLQAFGLLLAFGDVISIPFRNR